MIRHYLTFAYQAAILDEALHGWTSAESWSQEKNRLLMRFVKGRESIFVEVSVDLHLGYALVSREVHRARRNTINFFSDLLGATVDRVEMGEGERVIRMHFADGRELVLFLFGRGAGNVLLLRGGEVLDSFRSYDGEFDRILSAVADESYRDRREITAALRASAEAPVKAVMRAIPELGKRLAAEALYRSGMSSIVSLADRSDEEIRALLAHIDELYAECLSPTVFRVYHTSEEVVFALTELRGLAAISEREERFEEISSAVRAYRSVMFKGRRLVDLRSRMTKRLAAERARLERADAKRMADAAHTDRADEWERNGSMILAHLSDVPRGVDRVTLTDWEGLEHEIALNSKLTPVENAERYFKRARGAREAAARTLPRIEKARGEMRQVERLTREVERASTVEELEQLESAHARVFAMMGEPKMEGSAERFRRFEVVGGHEVYAGKNASNNDELTVRFARPNDYWFHARGTSGSHVVLRWNDAKSKPPKETIRQAASIAAYYSGAKNARTVPVAYTLKKYVRKPRGAAVGAVVMEREEVIMVEPRLPQEPTE